MTDHRHYSRFKQHVVAYYLNNHTIVETRKKFNVRYLELKEWVEESGATMHPQGKSMGEGRNPAYVADVKRRLEAGESSEDIAYSYGVTRQAISQIASAHGFPIARMRRGR